MSKEDKPGNSTDSSGEHEQEIPSERHSERRRRILKQVTLASGVTAIAANQKWSKPVVDAVLLPAHAQTSPGDPGDIRGAWFIGDDAPGSYDTGVPTGSTVDAPNDFLYDDTTDFAFRVTLSPPQGGVSVSVLLNNSGTNFGSASADYVLGTTNADGSIDISGLGDPPNSDWGDNPGDGTVTATFSAPGYNDAVATLVLS